MAATNINRVVLTGNLTFDPELRSLPSGMSVCKLRIACNTRRKDGDQWVDKPNYFDVTVWGAQGENCARYLAKGRPVAVDGRLEWREWQDKETGAKRSGVDIIADSVQFLGSPRDDAGGAPGGGGGYQQQPQQSTYSAGQQDGVFEGDFAAPPVGAVNGGGGQPAPAAPADDDIPF